MKPLRDLMDLRGRVALVTGGAGHIGSAVCDAFAEQGASVAILDLHTDACDAAAVAVANRHGVRSLAIPVDLEDEPAVRSAPARVADTLGSLDILVHCAALVGTSELPGWTTPFLEQDAGTWRKALEVNLTSVFILTQASTPALTASGRGSVIMFGSTYGMLGADLRLYEGTSMGNPAAYAASKGGLLQLTRWLATALAPAVRVNCISAGGVARNQPAAFSERAMARTPLRRMAVEEDFKGAAAYLASDLSAFVTGQNLIVDGGWSSW